MEILIAAMILTSSIAAAMYLFRTGYSHLQKIKDSNVVSSKVPQALGLITKVLDLERREGTEKIGKDVELSWNAQLVEKTRPKALQFEAGILSLHEIYLYEVTFTISYNGLKRSYKTNVLRYKTLFSPESL